MTDVAKQILAKMETRKYMGPGLESGTELDSCAICLDDYKDGQVANTFLQNLKLWGTALIIVKAVCICI